MEQAEFGYAVNFVVCC